MRAWDRVACFGDRSLTVEGTLTPGGGMFRGTFEPFWLAYPAAGAVLWVDYPDHQGGLELRVAPDTGIELPNVGTTLRVVGHFNDHASERCTLTHGDQAVPVEPISAQLICRERFVVDDLEITGTDLEYP